MRQMVARIRAWRMPEALRPVVRGWRRLGEDDGIEVAGFIAYTGLVSLFPFVIFLFALAGFVDATARAEKAVSQFFALMPREVASTLRPIVDEVLQQPQPLRRRAPAFAAPSRMKPPRRPVESMALSAMRRRQ